MSRVVSREDCSSVTLKRDGQAIVCASIQTLSPFVVKVTARFLQLYVQKFPPFSHSVNTLLSLYRQNFFKWKRLFNFKDDQGSLTLDSAPEDQNPPLEVGDLVYVMIDCSKQPLSCNRITVVPPEMSSVASHQLHAYREFVNRNQK